MDSIGLARDVDDDGIGDYQTTTGLDGDDVHDGKHVVRIGIVAENVVFTTENVLQLRRLAIFVWLSKICKAPPQLMVY